MNQPIKLLTIVEASAINAVAKTVLEFYRSARELSQVRPDLPLIAGSIVTFDRRHGDAPQNEFVTAAKEIGLSVDVIPERHRFDLTVIPALRRIVESRGPDVVVTNSVKSHFLVWRSNVWKKHPWVAFHHGYTDTDRKMRLYNRLDRWSLPQCDRLITVCQAFAHGLSSATGVSIDKISVQHNAIRRQPALNAPDVEALREQLGIDRTEKVVLSIGRLSREKAHRDLIAGFKLLREGNPQIECRLIIVGDGPERASLETAALLGCPERVIFTGQVSDVRTFYALADVFVLPSHSEGSPMVLLEAMAANLPVVATEVGGVPEIVDNNETAVLVQPSDPSAMAASIARLLSDIELGQRLTTNAAVLVDTLYSPEKYVRSLVDTYSKVIAGRRTTRDADVSR